MNKVKISVIMGIYNSRSKDILKQALNSILNQTYRGFELIICDDGSTNDCIKWAKDICKDDKRVKFIENKQNKGLAYTLNYCLEEAKGEYIARMDDDDESHLDRFEKQMNFLDNNPEISLVGSNANLFDFNGEWGVLKYPEYIEKRDFLYNSPIVHSSIMARREAFDLVNGYRDLKKTLRVEDYDLFMRMFAKGIKMYNFNEPLIEYREDKESIKKRKFKYRFNEMYVRYHGFKELKILNLKNYIYVIKPLIAGLIPNKILRRLKKKTF